MEDHSVFIVEEDAFSLSIVDQFSPPCELTHASSGQITPLKASHKISKQKRCLEKQKKEERVKRPKVLLKKRFDFLRFEPRVEEKKVQWSWERPDVSP